MPWPAVFQKRPPLHVSAISQNHPGIIEIKGLKTSHFKECKTALWGQEQTGSMGDVECPQSEPANNDLQPGQSRMVAATNCERVGDQSRNGAPVDPLHQAGRGQPLTYDFDVITDLFGSGLGAELAVCAITAGASNQRRPV